MNAHFDPDLKLFPEHEQTDAHGTTYTPYIDSNGCVGYACKHPNCDEYTFLYFNPSSDDSDAATPVSNVFVYQGASGNPAIDIPGNYYAVFQHERVNGDPDNLRTVPVTD